MTLTPERLWALPRVGAPLSLDQGRLVVPVTTYDPQSTTTLWRIHSDGRKDRLAGGKIKSPAVSPDRSSLAFLKRVGDRDQVHVQRLDGGEPRQVCELPLGAVGVRWVPDGRLIALATLHREQPDLDATAAREADTTARVTEDAVYRYWDAWLDHVYHPVIIDPADGSTLDLTPGATRFWAWPATDSPMDDLDVSPDASLVAFCADDSEPPHRQLSWSLFLVGIEGDGLRRLDLDKPGHSRRPRFTRAGTGIVYGYQAEPDYYASPVLLHRYDLATGSEDLLAPGWDRSPAEWTFDGESRLLFVAEDEGRSRLYRLSSVDGSPERLTSQGWVSAPTVADDGVVHVLAHSLTQPPEVFRIGPLDGSTHRLERVSDFTESAMEGVGLGEARELVVAGGDGDEVAVWVVDPPGADPTVRLPLVHLLHGGPHGVFGDAWHWRWNAQVVAGWGYRVALVNFHGSTGWGDAFARSIHGAWGDLPYRDVEAVTDYLVATGLADEDRMAVAGGSYGGYLAAWITAQTDRYACAVAHAAVTNFAGMYASDLTAGRARSYGAEIWEDRAVVERWSPSAHAAGYSTPVLVTHGERDARVPATQGLELYGVLVAKGVPARLVSYPDENHWILSRANSIHWHTELEEWFKRWL